MGYPFDDDTAERLESYGHNPHGIESIDEAESILFRETRRAEEEARRQNSRRSKRYDDNDSFLFNYTPTYRSASKRPQKKQEETDSSSVSDTYLFTVVAIYIATIVIMLILFSSCNC